MIPHPGDPGYNTWAYKDAWKFAGGADPWGDLSLDKRRGIVYFGTGGTKDEFYGGDRKGEGLFGSTLVALDAETGKYLWSFQLVHHDVWDFDDPAPPQLITINHKGRRVDAVAMPGKTCFLYVLDRVTGKPIWPIAERPVPHHSEIPGEQLWPTQPYPTVPAPFCDQQFTAADIDPYLSAAAYKGLADRLASDVQWSDFHASIHSGNGRDTGESRRGRAGAWPPRIPSAEWSMWLASTLPHFSKCRHTRDGRSRGLPRRGNCPVRRKGTLCFSNAVSYVMAPILAVASGPRWSALRSVSVPNRFGQRSCTDRAGCPRLRAPFQTTISA